MESSLEEKAREAIAQSIEQRWAVINDSAWEHTGTKEEIEIWHKKNEIGIKMLKAIGNIDATPEDVLKVISDPSTRSARDEMVKSTVEVAAYSEHFRVVHKEYNSPWPLSNRDFVMAVDTYTEDDKIFILAASVDAGIPPSKGVVRGYILQNYFLLEPVDSGTKVTYITSVDPKGSIPKWIINLSSDKQAMKIKKTRDLVMNQKSS